MSDLPNSPEDLVAHLEENVLLPQLGCPDGDVGVAVGEMLERVNVGVIDASYNVLDLGADERILEIGLGNGGHMASIFRRAPPLRFVGIDISSTMTTVAQARHASLIQRGLVALVTADALHMPFARDCFDKAVAINTIYFWPDLLKGLSEIRRVLRSCGVLVIAAITPEAAIEMPFAAYGFNVYDASTLEDACVAAGFPSVQISRYVEPLAGPAQDGTAREFALLRASVA